MAILPPSLWSRSSDLDPFRSFRREMQDMFGRLGSFAPTLDVGAATPAINVAETKDAIEITAELPGVEEKDIKLSLEGNRLVVSGEKKTESENKEKDWHVVERSWGAFHRSVALPFEPKDEDVAAHYDKGVLHVTVKKRPAAAAQTSSIPIRSGPPTA